MFVCDSDRTVKCWRE